MSTFRKTETGQLVKIAGNLIQKFNDKIFTTTHRVEDGKDYYTLTLDTMSHITKFENLSEYKLYITEPNETEQVYIEYNGVTLKLVSWENINPQVGLLENVIVLHTTNVTEGKIYYEDNGNTDIIPSGNMKTEVYDIDGNGRVDNADFDGSLTNLLVDKDNMQDAIVELDNVLLPAKETVDFLDRTIEVAEFGVKEMSRVYQSPDEIITTGERQISLYQFEPEYVFNDLIDYRYVDYYYWGTQYPSVYCIKPGEYLFKTHDWVLNDGNSPHPEPLPDGQVIYFRAEITRESGELKELFNYTITNDDFDNIGERYNFNVPFVITEDDIYKEIRFYIRTSTGSSTIRFINSSVVTTLADVIRGKSYSTQKIEGSLYTNYYLYTNSGLYGIVENTQYGSWSIGTRYKYSPDSTSYSNYTQMSVGANGCNFLSKPVHGVGDPLVELDAANKQYVDSALTSANNAIAVQAARIDVLDSALTSGAVEANVYYEDITFGIDNTYLTLDTLSSVTEDASVLAINGNYLVLKRAGIYNGNVRLDYSDYTVGEIVTVGWEYEDTPGVWVAGNSDGKNINDTGTPNTINFSINANIQPNVVNKNIRLYASVDSGTVVMTSLHVKIYTENTGNVDTSNFVLKSGVSEQTIEGTLNTNIAGGIITTREPVADNDATTKLYVDNNLGYQSGIKKVTQDFDVILSLSANTLHAQIDGRNQVSNGEEVIVQISGNWVPGNGVGINLTGINIDGTTPPAYGVVMELVSYDSIADLTTFNIKFYGNTSVASGSWYATGSTYLTEVALSV